jgi:hypothetical protein
VDGFFDILCPIFFPVAADILNHITLYVGYSVQVDELDGLDLEILVVGAALLLIERV